MRIERGAQVPLTVAAQRCSRPGALTVVAAPEPSQSLHSRCSPPGALTVAAQSLQALTVAAQRCSPPGAPYSRCRSPGIPRPSQLLRSVAALSESEDCWERFSESR